MIHLYLTQNAQQLERYQQFVQRHQARIDEYIAYLQAELAVHELPRAIVWTDAETACRRISDLPLPAYTNDYRVVISPDLAAWQRIYGSQLDGLAADDAMLQRVRDHYAQMDENDVLQIVGHELAHHSDWFLEAEGDAWFEEGMVEYVSRRYFLSQQRFEAELAINRALVAWHQRCHGDIPLSAFDQSAHDGPLSGMLLAYWRSVLAVQKAISRWGGVRQTFARYHAWHDAKQPCALENWLL